MPKRTRKKMRRQPLRTWTVDVTCKNVGAIELDMSNGTMPARASPMAWTSKKADGTGQR